MTDKLIGCQRPESIENVGRPLSIEEVSILLDSKGEYAIP